MGINSRALFHSLLEDLSVHLSPYVLDLLKSGADVNWWPGISVNEFSSLALARSFYKKFVDNVKQDANEKALLLFTEANNLCGDWHLGCVNSRDSILVGEFKKHVYQFLYPDAIDPLVGSAEDILSKAELGPGSSIGSKGEDFYTKLFASKLSTTSPGLYRAYLSYIWNFSEFINAELIRKENLGSPVVVKGNRLNFVPKRNDISRVICTEPVLNMYFQLGIGNLIRSRLASYFHIRLEDQPDRNRELARLGSLDGSFVTIDLSSASDSISLRMLDQLFPRDFVSWLKLCRSPSTKLPDGSQVALNMVSTMGNGFTFPLQTMIFACAVLACHTAQGIPYSLNYGDSLGSFAVFGDDIICHRDVARDVLHLIQLLGFRVNEDKTFVEGPFRESCGADYFYGQPVRGVYIKKLNSQQDRCVAINLLNRWSSETGVWLPKTVASLLRTVEFRPVPLWENDDAGIKVPESVISELRRDKHTKSIMYRAWEASPQKVRIFDSYISGRFYRLHNVPGLYLSFLRGTIRNYSIMVRHDRTCYKSKWRIAPNWLYSHKYQGKPGWQQRWETAVHHNSM